MKQKLSLSEKKLQILLGEEYINSNNYNNFEQNNFSPNSNIKRSNSNLIKDPENNAYISNTNIKKSKTLLNKTKKNNIPLSNLSNNNKLFYYNKVLEESKNVSRTHRTNQKENLNHKNGPALSASSSMEKIERYLMNKFAKTQLHFKSKINIMSSASKRLNKKMSSPYNKSLVEEIPIKSFKGYNVKNNYTYGEDINKYKSDKKSSCCMIY